MDTKLQDEVYTPIERWHKQYQQMKVWKEFYPDTCIKAWKFSSAALG